MIGQSFVLHHEFMTLWTVGLSLAAVVRPSAAEEMAATASTTQGHDRHNLLLWALTGFAISLRAALLLGLMRSICEQ
jgi:hypothetical protein